jgi:ATP-dependent RNA helicase DDX35
LTLLNVYHGYVGEKKNKQQWCHDNFVNSRSLETVARVRLQLHEVYTRFGLPLESCHGDSTVMRKALLAGLFVNVAGVSIDHIFLFRSSRFLPALAEACAAMTRPSLVLCGQRC